VPVQDWFLVTKDLEAAAIEAAIRRTSA